MIWVIQPGMTLTNFKIMTIDFYSLEQQDEFIFNIFDQKTNGTFLDVCCWHPIGGSNTYTLEKQFGWSGVCFDINDSERLYQWSSHRKSPFVNMDVTSPQFKEYLKNNIPPGQIIDYVSLDVDGLATLEALKSIIDAGVKFKAVTYEHEYCLYNTLYRDPARKILEDLGFVRLFSDIKAWTINLTATQNDNDTESFEDWWIHPDYFDPALPSIKASNLYYDQCIDILKKFKNANYDCKHQCCRAFPDEYTFYLREEDRAPMLELFRRLNLMKQGSL